MALKQTHTLSLSLGHGQKAPSTSEMVNVSKYDMKWKEEGDMKECKADLVAALNRVVG